MAVSKAAKVETEIGKTKEKIAELQTRLRDLEQKKTEIENSEIVGIVRNMNIPLDQLATLLTAIREGGAVPAPTTAPTSGQNVQSSADATAPDEEEDTEE